MPKACQIWLCHQARSRHLPKNWSQAPQSPLFSHRSIPACPGIAGLGVGGSSTLQRAKWVRRHFPSSGVHGISAANTCWVCYIYHPLWTNFLFWKSLPHRLLPLFLLSRAVLLAWWFLSYFFEISYVGYLSGYISECLCSWFFSATGCLFTYLFFSFTSLMSFICNVQSSILHARRHQLTR